MKSKYIVGEISTDISTCMGAIIFPEFIPHSTMSHFFTEITGAGFFYLCPDAGTVVYGKSISLGVQCDPSDEKWINKCLGLLQK